jgi:hypothetical protein
LSEIEVLIKAHRLFKGQKPFFRQAHIALTVGFFFHFGRQNRGGLHQNRLKPDVVHLCQAVQQVFNHLVMLLRGVIGGVGGGAMDDTDIKNMVVGKETRAETGGVLIVLQDLDFDGLQQKKLDQV